MKSTDSCKTTRVTISIPQEAGENLKQLVRFNTQLLNELGILAVQIDGTKPVAVDAKQNIHFPDAQVRSFAAASWKSSDLMSGCWGPGEKGYSRMTPIRNQIQNHSRDLLMVPYGDCLFPASGNLYIPNGRFNHRNNIVSTPQPKISDAAGSFVSETHDESQQFTANSPLYGHSPSFVPLAMSQMTSCFGASYQPPERPRTRITDSFHNNPLSNSLPTGCNVPFDAVFEPPRAKTRPRSQRKKASSTVQKLQEEVNQTYVPAAQLVKIHVPNKTLNSNDNILPVPRQSLLDSNISCATMPTLTGGKTQISGITTGSLSQTVVSECKIDSAVGSDKLSGKYERRLDLNFSEKARLKSSYTAPTLDAAFSLDAGSCTIQLASKEVTPILHSSSSDRHLSNPSSLVCELNEDIKFSCAIPETCLDGSKKNKEVAKPFANTSCRTLSCVASLSSENFHLNDKSGFLETVPLNVELFSGDAVSQSNTIELASLSYAGSEANSLQTSCLHQQNPEVAFEFICVEKKASLGLSETSCARNLNLTEEKCGSGEIALDLQASAEMDKLRGPVSAGDSRSEVDAQLTDLNSSLQMELNAHRSEESAANELDIGSIQKVALSLDKDLSCLTSKLDGDNVGRLLPLAPEFSGDCTVMEELSNAPLEKTEPSSPELKSFQCDLAGDASGCLSEKQQLPEGLLNMILANAVGCIETSSVNQDGGLQLPVDSPAAERFSESACVADVAAVPLAAETVTPLLISEPSQEMLQRINGVSPKPGQEYDSSLNFNGIREPEDLVLDNNLTDQNFIKNCCQVGLRGRNSDTDPVCLGWSGLSDGDIKVIKLNNRHSALDLHSPSFEELSVCSTNAFSDDLRRLNALVCEFDSLAVKSSSLLCVTKLTDGADSRLQPKKVRIVKSTEMSGNLRTKRKRNGLFNTLEKRRMRRKAGTDFRMFNKGHNYLSNDDLNVPLVSVPATKRRRLQFNSSDP